VIGCISNVRGRYDLLGSFFQYVITMPARDRNEGHSFRVIANLLDEGRCLLNDLVKPVLAPGCTFKNDMDLAKHETRVKARRACSRV
jgi:hypothetical protein